jgi:hypothetical protein
MRATQLNWTDNAGWIDSGDSGNDAGLVLYFGTRKTIACGSRYHELRTKFPGAHIVGCSTGGQIVGDDVVDDTVAAAAIKFDATRLKLACEYSKSPEESRECGAAIGRALAAPDLAGVLVLSDGLTVNGSDLVAGLNSVIGKEIPITGGMAGDGADFKETLVGGNCAPRVGKVAAVGFYGDRVRIGHGSAGGWDQFGPRRRITRSEGNVLFELDGEPALDLYKKYLGEEADGLPGTALLFPLRISDPDNPDFNVVRTVLAVDHEAGTMKFAGNMPEGWTAQLMRGNFDRLAAGAADAARQALGSISEGKTDQLALLVSCIGRRLLMGQRAMDELEAAGVELGASTHRIGFYSYGEISPHSASGVCQLHNQTMTVTTITEAA